MLTAFPISDPNRGYRRHECHTCYKERHKSYYADRPQEYKARATKQWDRWGRKAYADLRTEILECLGAACNCCGEDNPYFLAIDHVNNDGAAERRKVGQGLRGLRHVKKEIKAGRSDRYQTLCHNCNLGKKLNNGVCPHKEASTTRA